MSIQIVEEARFFLYSVGIGAAVSILYDFLRILRRVISHKKFVVAIEDFIYWVITLFLMFFLLYDMSFGVLRWFSIAGAAIGMGIYKKIFGEHLVEFMSTILKRVLHLVTSLILGLLRPIFWLKKKLTSAVKLVKLALCKQKKTDAKLGDNYESQNLSE